MHKILDDTKAYYAKQFSGLALSGKQLTELSFEECEFKGCDLSNASIVRGKFIDCHFFECNLSLAKVTTTKFREVRFDKCKAVGVNWSQAAWQKLMSSSPLKFHKCILNDSSFFGLILEGFEAEECKARDVDFREAVLSGAKFSHTDFSGSLFGKTKLAEADFTEATNYDLDVFSNDIKRARFSRFEALRLLDSLEIELVD